MHNPGMDTEQTAEIKTDQEPQEKRSGRDPGVIASWIEQDHQAKAQTIESPEVLLARWRQFKQQECGLELHNRKGERKIPTLGTFSLYLGFCSEGGMKSLAQRGEGFAAAIERVRAEITELIVAQLLKRGGNCIGAIFWLKNKAGWRDKTAAESQDEREDWLGRVQAARAASSDAGRDGAPRLAPLSLQLTGTDGDTQDASFDPDPAISPDSL